MRSAKASDTITAWETQSLREAGVFRHGEPRYTQPPASMADVLVGFEIEAELASPAMEVERAIRGYERNSPSPLWAWKDDSSLRSTARVYGREIVTSEPVSYLNLTRALPALAPLFPHFTRSFRAGQHVHINVQPMNRFQLVVLALTYGLFERSIFQWAGEGRNESIFCVPWANGWATLDNLLTAYYAKDSCAFASAVASAPKYSACNLQVARTLGSVEFRHPQTPDAEKFSTSSMLARMLTYVRMMVTIGWVPYMVPHIPGEAPTDLLERVFTASRGFVSSSTGLSVKMDDVMLLHALMCRQDPVDAVSAGLTSPVLHRVMRAPPRPRLAGLDQYLLGDGPPLWEGGDEEEYEDDGDYEVELSVGSTEEELEERRSQIRTQRETLVRIYTARANDLGNSEEARARWRSLAASAQRMLNEE